MFNTLAMKYYFAKIIIIGAVIVTYQFDSCGVSAVCPQPEDVHPCVCVNNSEIQCYSTAEHYELKHIFQVLNTKIIDDQWLRFDSLHVRNNGENTVPEDVFGSRATFRNIDLTDSDALTGINHNAFTSTNLLTERFTVRNTSLKNSGIAEREIFDAASKLVHLQSLYLIDNKLATIPDHAFKPILGTQSSLKFVSFSNNEITHIGDNAFYDLPALMDLELQYNKIAHINAHTFAFANTSSKHELDIDLRYNTLDSVSFDRDWYTKTHRPMHIHLGANRITYLSESIFSAFLNREPLNTVSIDQNPIYCDCRARWLIEDRAFYKDKVIGMTCQDRRDLFDYHADDFDYCVD